MFGKNEPFWSLPLLLVLLVLTVAPPSEVFGQNQDNGILSGTVRDKDTGKPIPWADVIVEGTGKGAVVQANGTFTLPGIPAGMHNIIVQRIGYEPTKIENYNVVAGQVNPVNVSLAPSDQTMDAIGVEGETDQVDIESSASSQTIDKAEFKVRAINNVTDALSKQPGVIVDPGGGVHVRGSRTDETKYYVDGMPVTNAYQATQSLNVSFAALSEIELLSGGFDAEYGNASSGIVNITTAEGGRNFSGLVRFFTDDFGAPDKTYFNSDDIAIALGGPVLSKDLRFHASAEGIWSDTYLPVNRNYQKHDILGITFRDRNDNSYQGQGKLTYFVTPEKKLSGEFLYNRRTRSPYRHSFSRTGWWSEESRHWWFEPLDDDYVFYSGPDHNTRTNQIDSQGSFSWTHTLSPETYYTAKLARFGSTRLENTRGKEPEDYLPFFGGENQIDPLNRYYAVEGDYPLYWDYTSATYTMKSDLTSQFHPRHRFKMGLQMDYHDMENYQAEFPDSNNPLGRFPDRYHVYAWGGAGYVQDRFTYEGMVVNGGLRWDFYDPGLKAVRLDNESRASRFLPPNDISLNARLKSQVSPRLGMAYPITDRDVLHFHYGRFYQLPSLADMYESIGSVNQTPGSATGNVQLQPVKTISYELGVDHQLTSLLSLDMTLFFKDIFGWIDTEEDQNGTLASTGADPALTFVNQAYGTVKGLEFKLRRKFRNKFGGSLVYTLSRATGTHSDENTQVMVGLGQLNRKPLTENPLDWDRTHTVVANLILSDPGVWEISTDYSYQSGGPYTPQVFNQRETLAEDVNSDRLSDEAWLDLRANKLYSMYGQEFRLYVEGSNLLDRDNIATFNPSDWPGNSGLHAEYYTEAGELGGAFNLHEVNASSDDRYIPLSDPRTVDPGRALKVGVMVDW